MEARSAGVSGEMEPMPAERLLFTPSSVAATPDISSYVEAILSLYIAFGLAFQVPIVVILLVRLGIVDIAKLKAFRGYFIVVAFVVAAVVTPPDVLSQVSLAVPMVLLYEIGIIAAGWFQKNSKKPDDEADAEKDKEKESAGS